MKIYNSQEEVNKDLDKHGNLKIKDDVKFNCNVKINGYLKCWDLNCWDLNCWDLNCKDLNCWDLKCWNLKCRNLNCWDLKCWNLKCWNLNCWDLKCRDLNCWDLDFYAIAIAYNSFKCKSWKATRKNYVIKCLDGEIEVKE